MRQLELSKIYANALYEISKESNTKIVEEITSFSALINASQDLENVLFLEVFTTDEKLAVVADICEKIKASRLLVELLSYLIQEKRISLFHLIYKELIVLEDHEKGFLVANIEGSDEKANTEIINSFKQFIKAQFNVNANFNYKKNEKITAGYKVVVEDYLIDTTLDNQFNKLKNLFV